jgi:hypothetical protein
MTTADVTPSCCQNPSTFDVIRKSVTLKDGTVKDYVYRRKMCGRCVYRKIKENSLKGLR